VGRGEREQRREARRSGRPCLVVGEPSQGVGAVGVAEPGADGGDAADVVRGVQPRMDDELGPPLALSQGAVEVAGVEQQLGPDAVQAGHGGVGLRDGRAGEGPVDIREAQVGVPERLHDLSEPCEDEGLQPERTIRVRLQRRSEVGDSQREVAGRSGHLPLEGQQPGADA